MSGGFEINESLWKLARAWKTYKDAALRPDAGPIFDGLDNELSRAVWIDRCGACEEEIFATGEEGLSTTDVVRHMLNSHGYRMDGRQFDNQNNEVGHA